MKRRDLLIAALSLAGIARPLAALPPPRSRRLGLLLTGAENDSVALARLAVFKDSLAALGWSEGRNLTVDVRWSQGDQARASQSARELVAMRPDAILSVTTLSTSALQHETRTIPVVFVSVSDPVGSGFVKALSHPGGNMTGFLNYEPSLSTKWLELLKEAAPRLTQVAMMFNPEVAPYARLYLDSLDAGGKALGVKTSALPVRSEPDIREAIARLGRAPGNGLIVMPESFLVAHRRAIATLAAQHKVPTIYFASSFVEEGGLISYSIDVTESFRSAAAYVDRILQGAKPSDLPVQHPSRFELTLNARTARALGLTLPASLLQRADFLIE